MTEPTSHAKGTAPDGQVKGPQSKGQFEAAAKPSASQSRQGKAADPKPAPKQNHDMPGPGGSGVSKGAAEKQMTGFTAAKNAEKSRDINKLKELANSNAARNQSKSPDKIKGKDDLQK